MSRSAGHSGHAKHHAKHAEKSMGSAREEPPSITVVEDVSEACPRSGEAIPALVRVRRVQVARGYDAVQQADHQLRSLDLG